MHEAAGFKIDVVFPASVDAPRLPVSWMTAEEQAAELQRVQARRAMDAAYEADLILGLAAHRPATDDPPADHPGSRRPGWLPDGPEGISEFLPGELSAVLNLGRGTADHRLRRALTWRDKLPRTLELLRAGELDERRANALADACKDASAELAGRIENALLDRAGGLGGLSLRQVGKQAAALLLELDPVAAEERRAKAAEAAEAADVHLYPSPVDGRVTVAVDLPADEAAEAEALINALARMLKADGDPRPIGVLRTHVASLLLRRPADHGLPQIVVKLTVTAELTALENRSDRTGEVDGLVITAAHLRQLLARVGALGLTPPEGGSLSFAVTGPDGELLATDTAAELDRLARRGCPEHPDTDDGTDCRCAALGAPPATEAYKPTAKQRAFVTTRDRRCRFPNCGQRVGWADLDHVIAHSCGGKTTCTNLTSRQYAPRRDRVVTLRMQRVTILTPDSARVPLCGWHVPSVDGAAPQQIVAFAGEVTVVVGANGAGKSALGLWLDQNTSVTTRRLIAHRRLWFQSAGPDLSPAQRESTGQNLENWRRLETSRYLDHADGQRASIALFDLLARTNSQNARMVDLYGQGATATEVAQALGVPLLDRLNRILAAAGLPVRVMLTEAQTFDVFNENSGEQYPIFRMSDGEKSALLLAAEILTAPRSCVQIIDEPERHLHRSISAGLIEGVIADRPDCHFIVLTHDLELASSLSEYDGRTFMLSSCVWAGLHPAAWELNPLDQGETLPESARLAILGGRREVLFIEGDAHSIDRRLYSLLFPGWTLFPAGGCDQVIRAVTGLRDSEAHHWVMPRGVVDGDGRNDAERVSLQSRGIMTLPVSEVENLYYIEAVLRAVALKQGEVSGKSSDALVDGAKEATLKALGAPGTLERLTEALAIAELRRRLVDFVPKAFDTKVDPIEVSISSPYPALLATVMSMFEAGDYDGLMRLIPVRDTAVRSQVAGALGFRHKDDYEAAARVRIRTDPELALALRRLIDPDHAAASAPRGAEAASLEVAT